jgi:hypothetical protein
VLGLDNSRRGIKLSLVTKAKKAAAEAAEGAADGAAAVDAAAAGEQAPRQQREKRRRDLGAFQPGNTVEGTVTAIHTKEVEGEPVPVWLELAVAHTGGSGGNAAKAAAPVSARLDVAHLADHPAAATALLAAIKVGAILGPLLVLQRMEVSCCWGAPVRVAVAGSAGEDGRCCMCVLWDKWGKDNSSQLLIALPACVASGRLRSSQHELTACCQCLGCHFLCCILAYNSRSPCLSPCHQNKGQLRVTRKPSLLAAVGAGMLPAAAEDVKEGQLLAGYVASVTNDAVFVR